MPRGRKKSGSFAHGAPLRQRHPQKRATPESCRRDASGPCRRRREAGPVVRREEKGRVRGRAGKVNFTRRKKRREKKTGGGGHRVHCSSPLSCNAFEVLSEHSSALALPTLQTHQIDERNDRAHSQEQIESEKDTRSLRERVRTFSCSRREKFGLRIVASYCRPSSFVFFLSPSSSSSSSSSSSP